MSTLLNYSLAFLAYSLLTSCAGYKTLPVELQGLWQAYPTRFVQKDSGYFHAISVPMCELTPGTYVDGYKLKSKVINIKCHLAHRQESVREITRKGKQHLTWFIMKEDNVDSIYLYRCEKVENKFIIKEETFCNEQPFDFLVKEHEYYVIYYPSYGRGMLGNLYSGDALLEYFRTEKFEPVFEE